MLQRTTLACNGIEKRLSFILSQIIINRLRFTMFMTHHIIYHVLTSSNLLNNSLTFFSIWLYFGIFVILTENRSWFDRSNFHCIFVLFALNSIFMLFIYGRELLFHLLVDFISLTIWILMYLRFLQFLIPLWEVIVLIGHTETFTFLNGRSDIYWLTLKLNTKSWFLAYHLGNLIYSEVLMISFILDLYFAWCLFLFVFVKHLLKLVERSLTGLILLTVLFVSGCSLVTEIIFLFVWICIIEILIISLLFFIVVIIDFLPFRGLVKSIPMVVRLK